MTVIPAINAPDLDGILTIFHRLEKFLPEGSFIHLDVCDARFTMNRTWGDPTSWQKLVKHLEVRNPRLEVHLMVENPEEVLESWLRVGAERAVVHVEALHDPALILRTCDAYQVKPILSLNPETPVDRLRPHLKTWPGFQTLAVHPGLAGQKFLPVVLEKIKFLRSQLPHAIIEVDGGINLETAMLTKACGADTIVSASYVLEAHDPALAFHELERI